VTYFTELVNEVTGLGNAPTGVEAALEVDAMDKVDKVDPSTPSTKSTAEWLVYHSKR